MNFCGSSLKCPPVWLLAVGSGVFRYAGSNPFATLTKALTLPGAPCCLCSENNRAADPFPGSWQQQNCLLNFASQSHGSHCVQLLVKGAIGAGCETDSERISFGWKPLLMCDDIGKGRTWHCVSGCSYEAGSQEGKKKIDVFLNWACSIKKSLSDEQGTSWALFWTENHMLRNRECV